VLIEQLCQLVFYSFTHARIFNFRSINRQPTPRPGITTPSTSLEFLVPPLNLMATSDEHGKMSLRTPHLHTWSNDADGIELQLQNYEHAKLGLVIYRCTYGSDADWAEFILRLHQTIKDTLTDCNGLDMLECMEFIVMEDPILEAATKTLVSREV
jgi:hypothetical protein